MKSSLLRRSLLGAGLFGACLSVNLPAQAAPGYCALGDATHGIAESNVSFNGVAASDCYAVVTGANINKVGDLAGLSWTDASNPWVHVAQSNRADEGGQAVSTVVDGLRFSTRWSGAREGEWTLQVASENALQRSAAVRSFDIALALKGANSYALWLFDDVRTEAVNTGSWQIAFATAGNPKQPTIPDLSHISLFVRPGKSPEAPVSEVPEPATLALLGAGLAGLVGFGRRRRS